MHVVSNYGFNMPEVKVYLLAEKRDIPSLSYIQPSESMENNKDVHKI
jgi:hypothetical protein